MTVVKVDPIAELQADHKVVRDILLELIDVASNQDAERALELLLILDKAGGPHFRFEEESLYPALEKFFGKEYHNYLLNVHDRIIRSAKKVAGILGDGEISKDEVNILQSIIRNDILPHPIECDGLSLLAEKLSQEELDEVADNLIASRKEDVALLEWADTVRNRKVSN